MTEAELLRIAASLERASEHPLALAIVQAANERNLAISEPTEVDSPVGRGVTGLVEGRRVLIGSAKYLESEFVRVADLAAEANRSRAEGATAILVAIDGNLAGAIAIADRVRKTTPEALRELRRQGIRVVMMTGDNEVTAERRGATARHQGGRGQCSARGQK